MIGETERRADPSADDQMGSIGHHIDLPAEHRDSKAVARAIERMIRDFPQVVGFHAAHAMIALDLGDTGPARAALDRFGADDFATVRRNVGYLVTLTALSMAAWRLGDRRYTQRLYELLLPHSGAQSAGGLGVVYQGPVDFYLGVLATLQKRRPQATRHFEIALATTERLGAWPWHARTEVAYASLLAEGNARERARARALVLSAAQAAAGFGMHRLEAEAEQVRAGLGARPKRSSPTKRTDRRTT
jgi:hypothetical protein